MLMRNTSMGAFDIFDFGNNQMTGFHANVAQVVLEWHVAGVAGSVP